MNLCSVQEHLHARMGPLSDELPCRHWQVLSQDDDLTNVFGNGCGHSAFTPSAMIRRISSTLNRSSDARDIAPRTASAVGNLP